MNYKGGCQILFVRFFSDKDDLEILTPQVKMDICT